jgi:hypothetical protein
MINKIIKTTLESENEIREYFKRKYNWDMTEDDYQEVSQSLYYLGKAIYSSLQINKSYTNNSKIHIY